jgi:DNA-binding HxlR family transcriptional regulator/peroxiredoxin
MGTLYSRGVKYSELTEVDCAVAQALGVVGDPWTLLVVREIAAGTTRFDDLQRELDVSRKTLTDRLKSLMANGIVEKMFYTARPLRYDYTLTDKGRDLTPTLVALQDWGARHVSGDGSLTATAAPSSAEARRVHGLVGKRVPKVGCWSDQGGLVDPVGESWTVLYTFPGALVPDGHPRSPHWYVVPGATGCVEEATAFRDRYPEFEQLGATIRGLSTQPPDELGAFSEHAELPFTLLSDEDLYLAVALRLPTFRVSGMERLKRLTMVIDPDRAIRAVQFPVVDPVRTVDMALAQVTQLQVTS